MSVPALAYSVIAIYSPHDLKLFLVHHKECWLVSPFLKEEEKSADGSVDLALQNFNRSFFDFHMPKAAFVLATLLAAEGAVFAHPIISARGYGSPEIVRRAQAPEYVITLSKLFFGFRD